MGVTKAVDWMDSCKIGGGLGGNAAPGLMSRLLLPPNKKKMGTGVVLFPPHPTPPPL